MTASSVHHSDVINVRGHSLNVLVEGSGPPLLLLNGFARPMSSWDRFAEAMTGRTVIRLDLPGAGRSLWPSAPQTVTSLATIVTLALDQLDVETADVVGFSQGGFIAQQLALDSPAAVRRLVLASTSCGIGATSGPWPWVDWTRSREAVMNTIGCAGFGYHVDAPVWSSIGFLGAIRQSTLVVCGRDDVVTPPLNSRVLADRIPRATLNLVPGGHDLQDPTVVQGFIDSVSHFFALREPPSVNVGEDRLKKEVIGI